MFSVDVIFAGESLTPQNRFDETAQNRIKLEPIGPMSELNALDEKLKGQRVQRTHTSDYWIDSDTIRMVLNTLTEIRAESTASKHAIKSDTIPIAGRSR